MVSLQISDRLLGQLQVALDLPFSFFNLVAKLLLALQGILQFIQRRLQFALDFVEVIALVFNALKIFSSLQIAFLKVLLFFVNLRNEFLLMCNLLIQILDLLIFCNLVLLTFLNGKFEILKVFFQAIDFLFAFLLSITKLVFRLFLFSKAL